MATRTLLILLVPLAALLVPAGCGNNPAEPAHKPQPNPDTRNNAPWSSASPDPRYAGLLPPRPRELDLTGVNPCTDLLTERQLRELNYDLGYAQPPVPDNSDIHGGQDCTFSSTGGAGGTSRNVVSLVGISTTEGALTWVTDPARTPDTRPEVVTIESFHAIVLPHPKLPDHCKVVVDTAEGQYLEVSSSQASGEGTSDEPFCAEAKRAAGMAIHTTSH